MTTVTLSFNPFWNFQVNGQPAVGYQLFTYAAGTAIKQTAYTDSTGATPLPNPIKLNAYGDVADASGNSVGVWTPPGTAYKYVLALPTDTDPPTQPLKTIDNVLAPLTSYTIPAGTVTDAMLNPSSVIYAIDQTYMRTAAESAAGVTPTNYGYPELNAYRYGCVADGVGTSGTNNRPFLDNLYAVAKAKGGGTIVMPYGTTGIYQVSGTDASPLIPTIQSDFSVSPQATPCQIYVQNIPNLKVVYQGSALSFLTTTGGYGIAYDGCNNLELDNPQYIGQTVMSGTVATTVGVSAMAILSLTQNVTNVTIRNLTTSGCYSVCVVTGDPAGFRTSNVTFAGSTKGLNGYYGIALQNSGDGTFIENAFISGFNRPVFFYGVEDVTGTIIGDTMNMDTSGGGIGGGLNSLVKAYSRATRNINLKLTLQNCYQWSPKFGFETQYNPANQVAPQTVQNVYLQIDELNNLPFASAPTATATTATLAFTPGGSAQNWNGRSGTHVVQFSDGEKRTCTFTSGSNSISWSGGLTNAVANVATGGGTYAIYFNYYAGSGGTVLQSTSAFNLFNNVTITGYCAGVLSTNVQLGTAVQCQINIDGLTYTSPAAVGLPATDLFNNNGFVSSRKFTYTPALSFGGASVGITYGTQAAEYYIAAGMCTVVGNITLTAKGSSTGTAQITMPFPNRADATRNSLITWQGASAMSGLGNYATGFLALGGSLITLQLQGAASTSSIADTNFTATSSVNFQVTYPL